MRCEWVRDRIDDYVDGELRRSEALLVRDHFESCPECELKAARLLRLLERVAGLPHRIEPTTDLWPSIARKLERRPLALPGGRRLLAVAAALLLAVAAVVVLRGNLGRPPRSALGTSRPVTVLVPGTALAEVASAEASFGDARDRLLAVLQTRPGALQPQTVATVQKNLRVIDHAISQITAALEQDPNNVDLAHQLVASYQLEISLLERATMTPVEL